MRIEVRPYDHPDVSMLIERLQRDYVTRYGGMDETPVEPAQFAPPYGLFLVGYLRGAPVACGGWRARERDAELKRMYVVPSARGRGLARAMLAELERTARADGRARMVLETGMRQPEAIALYRAAGYTGIPKFGFYAEAAGSVHLGKVLDGGGQAR